MRIPDAEHAIVEPRKLRDYLLSEVHPIGRFKFKFFSSLGYTHDEWGTLSADLRRHAASGEVVAETGSEFGRKFEISGPIKGPNGKTADMTSVWIILSGEQLPRFITAYPGARP